MFKKPVTNPTFSLELFPRKTDEGYTKLTQTIEHLALLSPDFISCTYGAGGDNRAKTLEILKFIQNEYNIPTIHHLTCVLHSKPEIYEILSNILDADVHNILALRGDRLRKTLIGNQVPITLDIVMNFVNLLRKTFPVNFQSQSQVFRKDTLTPSIRL